MVKVILDHIDLGHMLVGSLCSRDSAIYSAPSGTFFPPSRQWDADKGNWAFDPLEREPAI